MKKLKDTDFLYISTRLRAQETKLLSRERMERMLDARTNEEAAKVLSECGYEGLEKPTSEGLSQALSQARAETFRELSAATPNADIVDVFRIKYDYHNLKALLKSVRTGKDADGLLLDAGRFSPETVKKAVLQGETGPLTEAMAEAMEKASQVLSATGDPQKSDFLLDQACFSEMLSTAERSRSSFLLGYVRLQIDAINLRAVVRALRMDKGPDFLRHVLLTGGNVSTDAITAAALTRGSLEQVFFGALRDAAALGDTVKKGGRLTEFEKACDNALNDYLKGSRMVPFGDSVLIAYAAAKENEITAARIILSGRLSGVPTESIRERLRDAYV